MWPLLSLSKQVNVECRHRKPDCSDAKRQFFHILVQLVANTGFSKNFGMTCKMIQGAASVKHRLTGLTSSRLTGHQVDRLPGLQVDRLQVGELQVDRLEYIMQLWKISANFEMFLEEYNEFPCRR